MSPLHPAIAFFGTSSFSVGILEELKKADLKPDLIVTAPDKKVGRHLALTSNPVKVWAQENSLEIFETEKLDDTAYQKLSEKNWDLFVVASYGTIIGKRFLDTPKHGALNVHPSPLPLLRGPSPIQYTILTDLKDSAVTIMLMDEQVDHGPIIATEKVHIDQWPSYDELEKTLARIGGNLLARTIPDWLAGEIKAHEQDHSRATFTKKIKKEDGLISLDADPKENFRKIQAFKSWPGAYFFAERKHKKIRAIITSATLENNTLTIQKIIPEGKSEMSYSDFLRG